MTPHPQPLLDIRHHPDGSVVIKRYPFETFFNMDEWKELSEYCVIHSSHPSDREKVLELLKGLRRYSSGEYIEAELSDNEHDMRIHLEYENRIWEIMIELRQQGKDGE
jgi:hypothetical protein